MTEERKTTADTGLARVEGNFSATERVHLCGIY